MGFIQRKQYLDSLKTTWAEYQKRTGLALTDFEAFCFHLPIRNSSQGLEKSWISHYRKRKKLNYNTTLINRFYTAQRVGNIYTGSLFLGLLSLLENQPQLKAGDRIALFSYGSGAVSEIFSANLVPGFEQLLDHKRMEKLDQRTILSVADYDDSFMRK